MPTLRMVTLTSDVTGRSRHLLSNVACTKQKKPSPAFNLGRRFGRLGGYFAMRLVRSLASPFDDSIFSPPLLPRMLTKPRTVCGCQPVGHDLGQRHSFGFAADFLRLARLFTVLAFLAVVRLPFAAERSYPAFSRCRLCSSSSCFSWAGLRSSLPSLWFGEIASEIAGPRRRQWLNWRASLFFIDPTKWSILGDAISRDLEPPHRIRST